MATEAKHESPTGQAGRSGVTTGAKIVLAIMRGSNPTPGEASVPALSRFTGVERGNLRRACATLELAGILQSRLEPTPWSRPVRLYSLRPEQPLAASGAKAPQPPPSDPQDAP